jgi:hypothetical protein
MATTPPLKTDYVPLVPYENGSCSCARGLKLFPLVMAIFMVVGVVFATLIYTKSIPFAAGMEWMPHLSIAGAVLAPLLTIGLICLWKGAYNEIYPQGNWTDFLKRDWNDFLGHNYKHYSAWEKTQTAT